MTSPAGRALDAIRARSAPGHLPAARVDVHFQPDARTSTGATVLESLLAEGRWRTQFETGTSNGGLTAVAGGDRWRWESRLFGGAYDLSAPEHRPVYGALSVELDPYGAAPRFGSAFLILRKDVLRRSSLCFPDSVFEPEAVGTEDAAGAVLAAVRSIVPDDPLDRYVEVHVHGGVDLGTDVEAVVLDPSFRGTAVGDAATSGGVPVRWHPGYALEPVRIAALDDFRGPAVAEVAWRIADGSALTPACLGAAVASGRIDRPTAKKVWHLLAAFGRRSA